MALRGGLRRLLKLLAPMFGEGHDPIERTTLRHEAMSKEVTADDRAGAPPSAPAVDVDDVACADRGIDRIENCPHPCDRGNVHIDDRQAVEDDDDTLLLRERLKMRLIRNERFPEAILLLCIHKADDAGHSTADQSLELFLGKGMGVRAGITAGEEFSRFGPVAARERKIVRRAGRSFC